MCSANRSRALVRARHYAFYFAYYLTNDSLSVVGFDVAERGHCDVIHGKNKIIDLLRYEDVKFDINVIFNNLKAKGYILPDKIKHTNKRMKGQVL
jgi:chromosomal replication initiation ATPase DnaA